MKTATAAGRRENRPAPPLAPQTGTGSFVGARAGWWWASCDPHQKFTGEDVGAPPEGATADAERTPDKDGSPRGESVLHRIVGVLRRFRDQPAVKLTGSDEREPDDVCTLAHRSGPRDLGKAARDAVFDDVRGHALAHAPLAPEHRGKDHQRVHAARPYIEFSTLLVLLAPILLSTSQTLLLAACSQ